MLTENEGLWGVRCVVKDTCTTVSGENTCHLPPGETLPTNEQFSTPEEDIGWIISTDEEWYALMVAQLSPNSADYIKKQGYVDSLEVAESAAARNHPVRIEAAHIFASACGGAKEGSRDFSTLVCFHQLAQRIRSQHWSKSHT